MSASSFGFKISIQASDQAQAMQKMKAHAAMEKKLSSQELIRLGQIIEQEPEKLELAKKYLGV